MMGKKITLFSSEHCKYCLEAKKWLAKERVQYIMKDLQNPQNRQEFDRYNMHGIPLLVVQNESGEVVEVMSGFQPVKYMEMLKS